MKCPKCQAKIDYLQVNYQRFITYDVDLNEQGEFHEFNRDEYECEELLNYVCPLCLEELFTSYEEALKFMREEGKVNESKVD